MASDHPPDELSRSLDSANKRTSADHQLLLVDDADKVFHMQQHTKHNAGRTASAVAYELRRQSLIARNLAFLHEPTDGADNGDGGCDDDAIMICDLRHESLNQILKQSIEIEKPSKYDSGGGGGGDEDDTNNNHRDLLLGVLGADDDEHQHLHLHDHQQQHHQPHGASDSERARVTAIKQSADDRFAELMGDEVDLDGAKVSLDIAGDRDIFNNNQCLSY